MPAVLCVIRATPSRETSQPRTDSFLEYSAVETNTVATIAIRTTRLVSHNQELGITAIGLPNDRLDKALTACFRKSVSELSVFTAPIDKAALHFLQRTLTGSCYENGNARVVPGAAKPPDIAPRGRF
jgi:hypothetical protein